ncbi:hydrogenase expression/formation protein HypE [bacterium]|nr:hydrogenase expression/formation protein HypE [bacterium]
MSVLDGLTCPLPLEDYPRVLPAHGGGGTLMHRLIRDLFAAVFGEGLQDRTDAALLAVTGDRVAFTTDSFVVTPLEFPGGDIGSLAVHGTVNDLAMAGARPIALSAGFIIEEGLEMERLWRLTVSMKRAADEVGVNIVTGDTKVVERGKGDGLYINTAGVGVFDHDPIPGPSAIEPGDRILLSGDVGRHGTAVLAVRDGINVAGDIESDSAPLVAPVRSLLEAGVELHALRDLTRGGLASALYELARDSGHGMLLNEEAVPVSDPVAGFAEILGFDPIHIANEGRFIAVLPERDAEKALTVLKTHPVSEKATLAGEVLAGEAGRVLLRNPYGTTRILTLPSGEQLMRIC